MWKHVWFFSKIIFIFALENNWKKYKTVYSKAVEPHDDNQHTSCCSHPELKLCIWTQLFQTICILRVILHHGLFGPRVIY